ncbi:MAG TPA: hypothetical protein EYQ50_21695 [Verrucomicrobiales bacterium]|nr:hypothetical protein [Verrucomicrobiales bacterium]HIL72122.1 hypothetical protein [Verrucomicrobiota bacterium]
MKRKLGKHLPLEHETCLYILVSALDVFMTHTLLKQDYFTESNPIAFRLIELWDVQGMVVYKFGLVAFVCILTQTIARGRGETARRLLNLATLLTVGVVLYSFTLLLIGLYF